MGGRVFFCLSFQYNDFPSNLCRTVAGSAVGGILGALALVVADGEMTERDEDDRRRGRL